MLEIAPMAVGPADLVLGTEPVSGEGVTLAPGGAQSRWSLRARDAAVLGKVLGLALPERIGATEGGIAKLGPDEWYAVLPEGTVLPTEPGSAVSVVDVSSRAVAFVLEGPRAVDVLSSGCPLDLGQFPVGRATRTLFETVEVQIWRTAEERWVIQVWRSFAPWLWHSLAAVVAEPA